MKKVTKITALLAAVAMLMMLPDANALTAKAAEPVSYAVKYSPDLKEWRIQANTNDFNEKADSRSIYVLLPDIKDGDIVVVYNDDITNVALDLGSARLSNLTLTQNTQSCLIKSGGADVCHVQGGSLCSISGDVKNAYVYDTTTCTFTGNVDTLTIYATSWDGSTSNVSVDGTVEHLYVTPFDQDTPRTYYDLYHFGKGTLYLEEGTLQTPEWSYLNYDQYVAQVAPTAQNNSQAAQDNSQVKPSSEYDDVPKTGQSNAYIWFLGAALLFFAGSFAARRIHR